MDEQGLVPVGPGIGVIRVPVPLPVESVNVYAIGDPPEILVDCGPRFPGSTGVLKAALPCGPRVIIATHLHVDHYGAAGELQREWGCEVWMSAEDAAEGEGFFTGRRKEDGAYWEAFLRQGMPREDAQAIFESFARLRALMEHPVVDRRLGDGDRVEAGGRQYRVLITPGHTLGHVCLIEENGATMFAGDHLLPRITPNIGMSMRDGFNPIREYVSSLKRVAALSPRLAYPGHGPVIADPAARAHQIIRHHVRRGRRAIEMLEGKPRTGYEVAAEMFGSDLDPFQRRFAMAEAVAHLEWLVWEGWAARDQRGDTVEYSATRPGELFEIGREQK